MQNKLIALSLVVLLSACSSWLGEEKRANVEGERISVLVYDKSIKQEENVKIKLPRPEANNDWAQSGGYAHHSMQHLQIAKYPHKAWSKSFGNGSDSRNYLIIEPIVANDVVYVMDVRSMVSAYRLKDGKRLWGRNLTPKKGDNVAIRSGGLAYANGVIYATTGFGEVIAFTADKAKKLWSYNIGAPIRSAPTIYEGKVFVLGANNNAYAFSAGKGELVWQNENVADETMVLGSSSPVADNNVVIFSFSNGDIRAYRADNGSELWVDNIASARRISGAEQVQSVLGRAVMDSGVLYVTGFGNITTAIDIRTGARLWEKDLGGINQPYLAGKYMYVVTDSGEIVALTADKGKVVWVSQLPIWHDEEEKEGHITWRGPILASNRLIIVGSDGKVYAVSPYSGKILGYEDLNNPIKTAPIVAKGYLVFVTDDAKLVLYR